MQNKSQKLLESMIKYYNVGNRLKIVKDIVESNGNSNKISLRLIDWLVTNYSKSNNVIYMVNGKYFNMHQNYKDMLKAYSKKMFDPFRRHNRIYLNIKEIENYPFQTTVAQLTFFKWAIDNKILDYAIKNKQTIKNDMDLNTKHRTTSKGIKRTELCKQKTHITCVNVYPICVNF